jgi:2-methylisocitrate lyase-like PEP mutase family enzyme
MATSQIEKGKRFRELHAGPAAFVIANAWDAASARMLASLGFAALATSSGAAAALLGKRDHALTRDESLANARAIVEASRAADTHRSSGCSQAQKRSCPRASALR